MLIPVQTNLYNKHLLPKLDLFSPVNMGLAILTLAMVMASISTFFMIQASQRASETSTIEKELSELRQKRDILFPESIRIQKVLTDQIKAVDEKIAISRELLESMGQALPGTTSTPSTQVFNALSNASGHEVWLNEISHQRANRSLMLRGQAMNPQAIGPYIDDIRGQTGMSTLSLGELQIAADPSQNGVWSFVIGKSAADASSSKKSKP